MKIDVWVLTLIISSILVLGSILASIENNLQGASILFFLGTLGIVMSVISKTIFKVIEE